MKKMIAIGILLLASEAHPQTTQPVTADDPLIAINALRDALVDSFNKADLDRLLSHLSSDVVVTWQNGEVCRGPEAVRAYYDRMMTGPGKIVESVQADPKVTDRHIYGDWAVSWGLMNDRFRLTDGRDLNMNSRFTATIAREGERWKVTSFHVSVNAFDNAILWTAVRKASTWVGVIAGLVALLIGSGIGRLSKRAPVKHE